MNELDRQTLKAVRKREPWLLYHSEEEAMQLVGDTFLFAGMRLAVACRNVWRVIVGALTGKGESR